jgi:hypothetical protein
MDDVFFVMEGPGAIGVFLDMAPLNGEGLVHPLELSKKECEG